MTLQTGCYQMSFGSKNGTRENGRSAVSTARVGRFTRSKMEGRGTFFAPSNMPTLAVQTADSGKPCWVNFWARSRPRGPSFYFSDRLLPEVFCVNHFIWGPEKRSRGFCDFAASTARVGRFAKPMWKGGHFFALSNLPTLAVEAAKSQNRLCFFLDPKIKWFTKKTSGNRRSEK